MVPDMFFYHSFETHYDLLVSEDSRVVSHGLFPVLPETKVDDKFEWNKVPIKKRKLRNIVEENIDNKNDANEDIKAKNVTLEEHGEEILLLRYKNSGHRRTSPQEKSENLSNPDISFKCKVCEQILDSQGLLDAHVQTKHAAKADFGCQDCDEKFQEDEVLKAHIVKFHGDKDDSEEWNCNDCPFQGGGVRELMNHLKLTGHQPSSNKNDNRKVFKDFRQCYNCEMQFDGYHNLMTHRKKTHPSNRKCRNFPGTCQRGDTCWYRHTEPMETESSTTNSEFPSNFCEYTCTDKNSFMLHMKQEHVETHRNCEEYKKGQCLRKESECWFIHKMAEAEKPSLKNNPQVFQEVPSEQIPPDQMSKMFWMVMNLCKKVDNMEKRFDNMEKRFEELMI